MFCIKCGKELKSGTRHCSECGARSDTLLLTSPFVALQWVICAAAFSEIFPYILNIDVWWEIYTFPAALLIIPATLITSIIKWGVAWYLLMHRLSQDRETWMRWASIMWLVMIGAITVISLVLAKNTFLPLLAEQGIEYEIGIFDYASVGWIIVAVGILLCAYETFSKENRLPSVKRSGEQWFTIWGCLIGWIGLILLFPFIVVVYGSEAWSDHAHKINTGKVIAFIMVLGAPWKMFKAFSKACDGVADEHKETSQDVKSTECE